MVVTVVEIYITGETFMRALSQTFASFWVWTLLAAVFVDVILGLTKAKRFRVIDSTIGINGLIRHAIVILLVITIGILTRMSGFSAAVYFSVAFCVGMIINYITSILENVSALGVNLPAWVTKYFNKMRERYDGRIENSLINHEIETTSPEVGYKEIIIKNEKREG